MGRDGERLSFWGDGRGFLCFVAAKLQRNSSEAKKRAAVTCKNLLTKSDFPVKIRKQFLSAAERIFSRAEVLCLRGAQQTLCSRFRIVTLLRCYSSREGYSKPKISSIFIYIIIYINIGITFDFRTIVF